MGWPKGVKRIGYIKKDGTPARKRGERITMIRTDEPRPYTQTKTDDKTEYKVVKKTHGETSRAIVEVCPNCSYAYADGGYCSECGWYQVTPGCPHCKKAAR